MKFINKFKLNNSLVGDNKPSYFIADIGANHDGSLKRAKKLIKLAAQSGADAVKFQHFTAETIVSDYGFKNLKNKLDHQSSWKKSVFETYKDASINPKWTRDLLNTCKKYKVSFMTSPYSLEYVDQLDKYLNSYKIGSGDITWHEILDKISKKKKPIVLATGAASLSDVEKAVKVISKNNRKMVLMQCNTNYTGKDNNYNFINLNVLSNYKKKFKNILLGLSDHTFGHSTILGAIALGARVFEKHFTDNNNRNGPDHKFAMNPVTWTKMVKEARILEASMGNGVKKVEKNEKNTVVVQRRSIRAATLLEKGKKLLHKDLVFLRPAPKNSLEPFQVSRIVGRKLKVNIKKHECITKKKLD